MPDYTLQYVYSLGDFNTSGSLDAVPDERGARAQGNPPWDLQLNTGVTPQQLTITDDDTDFNEIGGNDQTLTNPITIDGVTYPVGSTVIINYVITTDSGFEGFSITIGSNNSGSNTTTAFITNQPMTPGQTYTFTSEGNIGNNPRPYSEFACFTEGTLIATPEGERLIEDLNVGDLVQTMDDGAQKVRWIGRRTILASGKMTPVLIQAGTLGTTQDLLVSPNHRMLVQGSVPQLLLGEDTALVAAKSLVNGETIRRQPSGIVTYIHIMFDRHQIIWSNGSPSESFYCGEQSLGGLTDEQLEELTTLFPDMRTANTGQEHELVRREAKAVEGRVMASMI